MIRPGILSVALFLASPAQAENPLSDHVPSQIQVERLRGTLGAAPSNISPQPLNDLTMKMIKNFEGWSATAYNDSAGYCTIGYGHLIALKRCAMINLGAFAHGITVKQGEALLDKDTADARIAVQREITRALSADQFGSLASFVFNVGNGNFHGSHLWSFTRAGNFDAAIKEFGRWIYAGSKPQNGLITRRKCEASVYASRISVKANEQFDRSKCVTLNATGTGLAPIDIYTGAGK